MMPADGALAAMPGGTSHIRRIMIVAGEASGDSYGADVVRQAFLLDPGFRFFGIGGVKMRAAGVETMVDSADMAVMGLVEVARHFGTISAAFKKLTSILKNDPPDLLILIDYPGFNIRLARAAKKAGVKVLYYISPKVWAWKAGRIRTIAANVDHIAVIFPFEVPLYERAGLPVTFVGHPLLDMVQTTVGRNEAAASFGLDPARRVVGLFPGSRRSEIERILPAILGAARIIKDRFPDVQFVIPLASTLQESELFPGMRAAGIEATITRERIHDLIRGCDAIVSVSGTVTLEIALVGTPMVIIYRLAELTYRLARRLVKISHIGLCNIIAGETIVKELIQHDATAERIAEEIGTILTNNAYTAAMRTKLATVRSLLERGGASAQVARLVNDMTGNV